MEKLKLLRLKLNDELWTNDVQDELRSIFVSKEYGLMDEQQNEDKKAIIRQLTTLTEKDNNNKVMQHLITLSKFPWDNQHIKKIIEQQDLPGNYYSNGLF